MTEDRKSKTGINSNKRSSTRWLFVDSSINDKYLPINSSINERPVFNYNLKYKIKNSFLLWMMKTAAFSPFFTKFHTMQGLSATQGRILKLKCQ